MSSTKSEVSKQALNANKINANTMFQGGLGAYDTRQMSLFNALTPAGQRLGILPINALGQIEGNAPNVAGVQTVGEPKYLGQGFLSQRAALTDASIRNSRAAAVAAGRGAEGNPAATLSAADLGTALAQRLTGSNIAQAGSRISQTLNLYGMLAGASGQAGNASLGFAGNELGAINMLPNYNQTYANVLGGINAVGSGYGAFQQAQIRNNTLAGMQQGGVQGGFSGSPTAPASSTWVNPGTGTGGLA